MDLLNSSEAQRQPLNSKSTASNTNPAFCGCSGLKDYTQAFPQPHFFKALHHGLPNCKYSQDNCEEKSPIQPQFFSSFPLYPPFFHNSAIPSNSCCPHNPLSHIPASEKSEKRHPACDQTQYNNHSEKERSGFMVYNTNLNEEAQMKNGFIQPELQYIGNPFYFPNSPDSTMNFLFHRCACGDSFPWACASFFLPIITYSVSWNSQKSSINNGIFPCASAGAKQNSTEDQSGQRYTSMCTNNEVSSTSLNAMQGYRNFPEGENCLSAEIQCRKEEQNFERPRSSVMQESSNIVENSLECQTNRNGKLRNGFSAAGNDSNSVCIEQVSEDIGGDEEEFASVDRARDENDNSNLSTFSNFSDDPLLKENESQLPSGSQSFSDIKKIKTEDGSVLFSEGEINPTTKETNSIEEWEGKTLEIKPSNSTELIPSKKFINNFTIADVKIELYERAQVTAAAGDLGGDNCTGYKINIQEIEEDHQYTISQETQAEGSTNYDVYLQADVRKSEPLVTPGKVAEGIPKKSCKSGIAKLKEPKRNAVKNIKEEPSEKESSVMKRKHSCYPFDNTVSSKIQKTKNSKAIQQHQGLTKQKTANNRTDLVKKDGSSKPQLAYNSHKNDKCLVKKTKN